METRRLELLTELSRLGSMREVADALGITTSSVSQQIAVLAGEMGVPLIEPHGRRVLLTPQGRRLAEHARDITHSQEPAVLDTLGAAYAEAGPFSRAVEAARNRCRVSSADCNTSPPRVFHSRWICPSTSNKPVWPLRPSGGK